jgi:hypothetical protein
MSKQFVRMFKPQFAELVERGEKLQTVRPTPKRMPKVGDRISLRAWQDKPYRSKQRVLREAVITEVSNVWLGWNGILINGVPVDFDKFARADGFTDSVEMHAWFRETHGIPLNGWRGILMRWSAKSFLFCDGCGKVHEDSPDFLMCDCGRVAVRMEWATHEQIRNANER